jgi:DNA polymerase family A
MSLVNCTYEHKLAYVYHQIDKIGLFIDQDKLSELRKKVITNIKSDCEQLSQLWNCHVYVGRENNEGKKDSINLNASSGDNSLLKKLQKLGFIIPKVRRKDKETGDISYEDSAEELALRRAFAEEQDPNKIKGLKLVLDVRELSTLKNRYINAKLYNSIYYSNYNVSGPVTGRRSSRKTSFGLGGNAQNFPTHYSIGQEFLKCITARPGKIFIKVDQAGAEDWVVSVLAENYQALRELASTEWPEKDRHTKLASFLFGIPISSRSEKEWKGSIERYLGKKTRHASNYLMRGQTMSDSLAKEGFNISKSACDDMLVKVAQYDPNIGAIFHSYIKREIFNNRKLTTPLGRERIFFGLRQNDSNYKIISEACAYIPQSIVADNTGLAVIYHFDNNIIPVNEAHDSITNEVDDDINVLWNTFQIMKNSFKRTIKFHNGIEIEIPIEGEVGYNFDEGIKIKTNDLTGLEKAYASIAKKAVVGLVS